MPRDLFQPPHDDTPAFARRAGVVPFSVAAHVVVIGVAVLVPAIAIGALPDPRASLLFVDHEAVIPVVPPPPVLGARPHTATRSGVPIEAPNGLPPVDAEPVTTSAGDGAYLDDGTGVFDGVVDGLPGGDGALVGELAPPPPIQKPVRAGGVIKAPVKIRDVAPVYPDIARTARVQGTVTIEATIDPMGHVTDTRVLRSVPLLDQAALTAVRQWEFTPTRLNGEPVAVIMTVTVQFRLN